MNFEELEDHLRWFATKAGVHIIALCRDPHEGFKEVKCRLIDKFYGIQPEPTFNNQMLDAPLSYKQAQTQNLVTADFPEYLWDRAIRIAKDMRERSIDEGFEFYNGHLARILNVGISAGKSPIDQILNLDIGRTSHFTSIGTNQHFSGYKYRNSPQGTEPALPLELNWANVDWREILPNSPLANTLSIHLMLYNDYEVAYVRRGKVGVSAGMYNSTVNGVIEFCKSEVEVDPLGFTAKDETLRELGLDIHPANIKWIACGVTLEKCQCSLLGVYRTDKRMREFLSDIPHALEQREISERSQRFSQLVRQKEIFALQRRFEVVVDTYGVGPWSFPIPRRLAWPGSITQALNEKVSKRTELQRIGLRRRPVGEWHPLGAVTLLLTMAHISDRQLLIDTLRQLREEQHDDYLG